MIKRMMVLAVLTILAITASPAMAGGGVSYRGVDLSGNWTDFTVPAINDQGVMIGNRRIARKGLPTETLAYKKHINSLNWGNLAGFAVPTGMFSSAFAAGINDLGTVVGHSAGRPAVWMPKIMEVPGLPSTAQLTGVNNANIACGRFLNGSLYNGIRYDLASGHIIPMTKAGTYSEASAINSGGDVTGFIRTSADPVTGESFFLFREGYGHLGQNTGRGYSVNSRGTVVGHHSYPPIPFMQPATGGLYQISERGYAYGINDSDQVVGVTNFGNTSSGAFIYSELLGLIDLNTVVTSGLEGWKLDQALDINNKGQIVGLGTVNGVKKSFLLIPN